MAQKFQGRIDKLWFIMVACVGESSPRSDFVILLACALDRLLFDTV